MLTTSIKEKAVSFKEIEKVIYKYICEIGRGLTNELLETYDKELGEARDKKALRNKGSRKTTIKTVYGEVEYRRNIYQSFDGDGHKCWVYLLDEAMGMDKIGLMSTNLAEKIAFTVAESSYRATADTISSTCGQTISHGGAWKVVQSLGTRISDEETEQVVKMNADQETGEKITSLLFEEMDGVWLKMQGKQHKKAPKQEMKVSVTYEGWKKDGKNNSRLSNKYVMAGMEKSADFHEKREAQIRAQYQVDEIKMRVLNGDGGSWIKDPYEPETVFQLDRFHIYQDIKRKIPNKEAQKEIRRLFEAECYDEMFRYIEIYATSTESADETDKTSKKARELYTYLENNRKGLIPWQKQRTDYPEPAEGIVYKNMGVQENQNCTTITMRMKGNRRRWSCSGAHNMAKLLSRLENKELMQTIDRYTEGFILEHPVKEMLEGLSAAKAPKSDGKGNAYIDAIAHHLPLLDAKLTEGIKGLRKAFA